MKLLKSILFASALSVAAGPVLADEMTIVSWGGAYSKSQLRPIMNLTVQKPA